MKDFKTILVFSDYEDQEILSKNIDKKRIENYASKFQNQIMRDLIGEVLYSDLCKYSNLTINLVSASIANDSVIVLASYPADFGIGSWFYLTLNNIEYGFFQVKTFNGSSFTCGFNSTGLTFASGFGKLFFTEYNFNLRDISKPYLVFGALSRFAPIANVSSTAYGFQSKKNDYSDDNSNNVALVAEYKRNIDYYGRMIIDFLRENKVHYPLYIELSNEDNFNYRENIAIRPKKRRLFDVKRK